MRSWLPATLLAGSGHAESALAAETYRPGQVVSRDGTVGCVRHHEVQDNVKAGTRAHFTAELAQARQTALAAHRRR